MNGQKALLLIIAFTALGIAVLPQTVSMFAGQHYWYNLSSSPGEEDFGGQVPCEKCHADVADEMSQLITIHSGETGYGRFECEYCHRTFWFEESDDVNQTIYNKYYYTFATIKQSYANYEPGKEAHAATTVPCMYCHSGAEWGGGHPYTFTSKSCSCHGTAEAGVEVGDWRDYYYHGDRFFTGCSKDDSNCPVPATEEVPGECIKCHGTGPPIYIPPAGGFGLTADATNDTGSLAAHKAFVLEAIKDDTLADANEACIACHTWVPVKINWTHARSLEFDIGMGDPFTTPEGPHNWTIMNWDYNGTAKATVWGNTTGSGFTTYQNWPGENPANYSDGYT